MSSACEERAVNERFGKKTASFHLERQAGRVLRWLMVEVEEGFRVEGGVWILSFGEQITITRTFVI